MARVLKYPLASSALIQEVWLPSGSRVLSVQVQCHDVVLYAEVPDLAAPMVQVPVTAVLTGGDVPPNAGRYVGTAMLQGGAFVKHFYVACAAEVTYG